MGDWLNSCVMEELKRVQARLRDAEGHAERCADEAVVRATDRGYTISRSAVIAGVLSAVTISAATDLELLIKRIENAATVEA